MLKLMKCYQNSFQYKLEFHNDKCYDLYFNDFKSVVHCVFKFIMYAGDTIFSSTLSQFIDSTQHRNKSVESLTHYELSTVWNG